MAVVVARVDGVRKIPRSEPRQGCVFEFERRALVL